MDHADLRGLGRTPPTLRRRVSAVPVVARWYLAIAWGLFVVIATIDFDGRRELADPFGYSIGDLGENLPWAVAVVPVATFVNVGVLQILYVTVIFGAVGPQLAARRERVVAAVFLGTSVFAGLAAGSRSMRSTDRSAIASSTRRGSASGTAAARDATGLWGSSRPVSGVRG